MPKDDSKDFVTFPIKLPDDLHHRLKVGSALTRKTLHDFIIHVLTTSTETERAAAQLVSTRSGNAVEVRANE